MITKSDLELVCNYSESTKPTLPVSQLYYLEFIKEDSEEMILNQKRLGNYILI